jgi:hypothetical protein
MDLLRRIWKTQGLPALPQHDPGMQPPALGLEPQQAVSPGPGNLPESLLPEAGELTDMILFISCPPQALHRTSSESPKMRCSETRPHDVQRNS